MLGNCANLTNAVWIVTLASLAASGCAQPVTVRPKLDWLKTCEQDTDCGDLACLCGVCTATCSRGNPCVRGQCTTPEAGEQRCLDVAESEQICAPDCSQADCTPRQRDLFGAQSLPPTAAKVIAHCPMPQLSRLPLFFLAQTDAYEGTATVGEIKPADVGSPGVSTRTQVILEPDNHQQPLSLTFNEPTPSYLSPGEHVNVLLRQGGEGSAHRRLFVVRSSEGKLLLVSHDGDDRLLRDGVFASKDAIGATLDITRLCEDHEGDCFYEQVQATFSGTFSADSSVTLNGDSASLRIADSAYLVAFWGGSVEGRGMRDCPPDITPGRYLDFTFMLQ